MAGVTRDEVIDCANPKIDIFLSNQSGALADPFSLEFIIFDVSDAGKQLTPVQVFPASGRQTVNLADCPTGERLSIGRYVAKFTVPTGEPFGSHEVRWFFKETASSAEQTQSEEFEVLSAVAPVSDLYALVQDLRDEGITVAQADDARVQFAINLASRFIDQATGRFFNPRTRTFNLDGGGKRALHLREPIIAITSVKISIDGVSPSDQPIDLEDVAIYNRHISEELFEPDDRDNPRLEFKIVDDDFARLHSLLGQRIFNEGRQNIEVVGVFGYTDPDGSSTGKTPDLIRRACVLLTLQSLPLATNTDALEDAIVMGGGRVKRMRTRDQEIEYFARAAGSEGAFTGNNQIDNLLLSYMRPPNMSAV